MKTINQLQSEITLLVNENEKQDTKVKVIKKNEKRIEFLKFVIRFLETNPTKEYLESERIRLSELIAKIELRYPMWRNDLAPKDVDPKKWRSIFNKETGFTKVKKQMKTIAFIGS